MLPADQSPTILLLHDGELTDLCATLSPLGLDFVERRGDATEQDRQSVWDLVITSSKRMLELQEQLLRTSGVRIAVLNSSSRTLRARLRQAGAHLLVRRPVHPAALRLLVLHSLYRGPEKRRNMRVSVGASVRYRTRLRRRSAILAELSVTGCRLLAPSGSHHAKTDGSITVQLPPDLVDGRSLSLSGSVVRVSTADAGSDAIAIRFGKLRASSLRRLDTVVAAHSDGPAILDDQAALALRSLDPETAESDAAREPEESESERRSNARRALSRRIIALGDEAARVLIGRDLSAGGMRVEPTPGLGRGDRLQLALHVHGAQPLVVSALVARDDGDDGLVLTFEGVNAAARHCLEQMLHALPTIEDSGDDDGSARFVSEILERQAG